MPGAYDLGSLDLSLDALSADPTTGEEDDLHDASAEKKKQRKQAHEKARKARRKAEKQLASPNVQVDEAPEWIKKGRLDVAEGRAMALRVGKVSGLPANRLCSTVAVLNDHWIPGIGNFVMLSLARHGRPPQTAAQVEAAFRWAVEFGVQGEADILAKADVDFMGDVKRAANGRKHLTSVSDGIRGAELAVFRKCYPLGTDAKDFKIFVDKTPNGEADFQLSLGITPHIETNGPVEEALYTVAVFPHQWSIKTHVTLPMFRKAIYDVERGSNESLVPAAAHSYRTTQLYKIKDEMELARWTKAWAPTLTEEQLMLVNWFAGECWNRDEGGFGGKLLGHKAWKGASRGQINIIGAFVPYMGITRSLGLEVSPSEKGPFRGLDKLELMDMSVQFGMEISS